MHVVIIGNGISGITAARFVRKLSDYKITVISSESDHFYSRTALMYIYMGHMAYENTKPYEDYFWPKNRIELKKAHIDSIDFQNKTLLSLAGESIKYDKLVLATGSSVNKFGWPGQDLKGVGGLYSIQDLENMEAYSKNLQRAVIVGGGLIGIEMAEMFHSRHIPVTFLVREKSYWDALLPKEESEMVNRHILANGIDLRLETELKEIIDDGTGKVKGVITSEGEELACGFVGLTAGVHPNVGFLKDSDLKINRGIQVNNRLETNIPDVYAIGDCAEILEPDPNRRGVEAVWYTGRMMGETVAYNIVDKPVEYHPGIWFNSAKFIDIEYQIYGEVSGRPADHHASLYWEHEDGMKAIRIVYDKNTNEVIGFNLMGIRFRHEVCEKWIKEKASLEEVVDNLGLAEFDPELFKSYIQQVVTLYNKQTGGNLKLKRKSTLNKVFSFLKK